MYRGFDFKLGPYPKDRTESNQESYKIGSSILAEHKSVVKESLEALVLRDGTLDGAKMQEQWFPQVEADLFISHSHKNEETAIVLAGFLYKKFGIKSFIDSTVWSYSGELLNSLDKAYCSKGQPNLYDYDLRNLSTSHVYLMLSGALSKMIDSTECVFFLNTPESVKPGKVIDSTLSPWIYSEVLTTQIIRKRLPEEHARRQEITKSFSDGGKLPVLESFAMTHKLELGHLTRLDIRDNKNFFTEWHQNAQGDTFKLDGLYKMHPEFDLL
jgi:hypothetical protein